MLLEVPTEFGTPLSKVTMSTQIWAVFISRARFFRVGICRDSDGLGTEIFPMFASFMDPIASLIFIWVIVIETFFHVIDWCRRENSISFEILCHYIIDTHIFQDAGISQRHMSVKPVILIFWTGRKPSLCLLLFHFFVRWTVSVWATKYIYLNLTSDFSHAI